MNDEINILDYLKILIKRKWLIIALIIISAAAALIYSINQPSMYKASATIMPVDAGMGGLAAAVASLPFLGGAGGGGGDGKLAAIISSYALARQVSAGIDGSEYFPELTKNQSISEQKKEKIMAEDLQGAVGSRGEGSLMVISVSWTNPDQAASLANIYVRELGKFLNQRALNVNFQVIDPAVPPVARFSPKIRTNVMLGGVLGGLMGFFLAFFFEYLPSIIREIRSRSI